MIPHTVPPLSDFNLIIRKGNSGTSPPCSPRLVPPTSLAVPTGHLLPVPLGSPLQVHLQDLQLPHSHRRLEHVPHRSVRLSSIDRSISQGIPWMSNKLLGACSSQVGQSCKRWLEHFLGNSLDEQLIACSMFLTGQSGFQALIGAFLKELLG
eukprot:1158715-Pelagomonas_calceolata.AAC.4